MIALISRSWAMPNANIDDVHLIAGHMAAEEEMFHTFCTLYQLQKQMVFSRSAEVLGLDERIVARLRWGVIVTVSY